ncbi:putative pyridine nucleotide-disulphide oxidoreductase [Actinacidiphila reveromycinica]|uniref:Putative pyridine nucleotide-disulphide oxidoreductase n=1 Tax=Actinacidiphila reveromycinica TaxID=659352 RepID=A0A7U3UN70_9ACTN|nr:FAD-dependent oxidoreductase [Streptomyces sp. SN-593]BBA95642.1 putative pyridine nucleotide-disulphide oxidoreductase [Streptomyces sp. SN-593]
MRTEERDHDVVVVGGGLAGVCAAVAAARLGRSVALVHNRPVLGGNSSSEVRVWVCGATAHGVHRYARETGIMGELYTENQYRNPEGNPHYWDQVVLDAVLAEPLVDLYLNTDVREVAADGPQEARTVRSVTGWTMGAERTTVFRAAQFLDCTGDGLVGHLAGARYRIGREARSQYGESWAPEVADEALLGSTILFSTKDAGRPVKFVAPSYAKDLATTPILRNRVLRTGDNGCDYWWIEWGGELDTVHDNERIRDELQSVVMGVWDHIKNSGEFDAANLTLEWAGSLPGKREYRRFVGDHTLTQQDILGQRQFADRVAFGGWSVDLHPVQGMYAEEPGARQRYADGVFHIPLRCLYSANVTNLLFAGRNISATHIAFGATRVMATCATLGEAAGTAAALCAEHRLTPRELAHDRAGLVAQTLLRQDASVIGVRNTDPGDLARGARVTASSTQDVLGTPRGGARADGAAPEGVRPEDAGADGARAEDAGADGARAEPYPLARDVALLLPADPALDAVELLARTREPGGAELTVELWGTGLPENGVPADHLATVTVPVPPGGPHWVRARFDHRPARPHNVVVVVRARRDTDLYLGDGRVDGVLSLRRRAEGDAAVDHDIPEEDGQNVLEWSARELRRRSFCFHAEPPTAAFAPDRAVGGYQRPYGGPQMWSSAELADPADADEWLQLEWDGPVVLRTVQVVFDDDVDEYLNNLHRHRTPFEVMPELVRDYRVLVRGEDGRWRTVETVRGNRRRHRVHRLAEPVRAGALRIAVDAVHGARHAHVVAVRAYEE